MLKTIGGDLSAADEHRTETVRLVTENSITASAKSEHARFSHIVEEAGSHLGDGPRYLKVWKGASGFAHGRQWASVHLTELTKMGDLIDGVQQVSISVNPQRCLSAFGHAVLMTREGYKLYDHKCKHWTAHKGI